MTVGTDVIIRDSEMPHWDGERGRIMHLFTGRYGQQLAIIRLDKIALEVVFPVTELERVEVRDAQ